MRLNVVEEVLRACRADPTLTGGGTVVVALSGGPDSSALLHALTRARRRLGLELVAAHLDHGVHRASVRHARRVAALCAELDVELVTAQAHLGRASEERARTARYALLDGIATDRGARTIALGHTADDQVETVLLHLLRGSGVEGLAAMARREGLRFRPLLRVWRPEIESYCARHALAPVTDPTNRDPRYLRNRVRRELVPVLEALAPGARRAVLRLADAARQEHAVVSAAAEQWLAATAGGYDRAGFRRLPAAVQTEVLRSAWAVASPGEAPGDSARLNQARGLVTRAERHGTMRLGGGLELAVDAETFAIARTGARPRVP